MKLIAKAKPVKIRINSGGEEHSSLDSLKMNFSISDVKELLDGRLSRWLRQQNQSLLAEEIDNFKSEDLKREEGILAFINLFFCKELQSVNVTSLFDVAVYWLTQDARYRRNGELLFCPYLLENNLNAAKYAYKNGYFSKMCWGRIFMVHKGVKDPEALYILGKMFFEGSYGVTKDLDEGYNFIKEAAALGWEEATKFVSDKIYEKNKKRFSNIDKDKIKKHFILSWPNMPKLENALKLATNNDEEIIISFLITSREFYEKIDWSTSKELLTIVWDVFQKYKNGIMNYEVEFIIAILGFDVYNRITITADTKLNNIKNQYPPAKILLEQGSNMILFSRYFMHLKFKDRLKLIITHIFDFE